jgi:hypothetical protein
MTKDEFSQQLDELVTKALNTLGTRAVFAELSATMQFVEVAYDLTVMNHLASQQVPQENEQPE